MQPVEPPGVEQPAGALLAAAARLADATAAADAAASHAARVSTRAADLLAAWHCPEAWCAAARLVALPTFAAPDAYPLIAARVAPAVADLVQRF